MKNTTLIALAGASPLGKTLQDIRERVKGGASLADAAEAQEGVFNRFYVSMLRAGEDRRFLARRLIRMAVEDIGLADPFGLRVALDAAEAFERLGEPEGDLALVQAAVYLARARKSNALYVAHGAAQEDVERTAAEPVRGGLEGLNSSVGGRDAGRPRAAASPVASLSRRF